MIFTTTLGMVAFTASFSEMELWFNPGVVTHTYDIKTWETESSSRPTWATKQDPVSKFPHIKEYTYTNINKDSKSQS